MHLRGVSATAAAAPELSQPAPAASEAQSARVTRGHRRTSTSHFVDKSKGKTARARVSVRFRLSGTSADTHNVWGGLQSEKEPNRARGPSEMSLLVDQLMVLASATPLPADHPWSSYTGASMLSKSPLVLRIPNFLTAAECLALRTLGSDADGPWPRQGQPRDPPIPARLANSHRAPGREEIGTWFLDRRADDLVKSIEVRRRVS